MNAVTNKSKSEKNTSMVIGIIAIVVLTLLSYIGGYLYSQSNGFIDETNIHLIFKRHGFRYFSASLSMIVAIIMYCIEFNKIADRKETEYSFIPNTGGKTFVYKGWGVFAVVTALITVLVGFLIHCFAFEWQLDLVKPLMIWVLIIQGILTGVVFVLPFAKPLKKVN